jgi:hypothetical protein
MFLQLYVRFLSLHPNWWEILHILKITRLIDFVILDVFPSSGEEKKTPTLLGPLGRANLKYRSSKCLPPPT